MSTIGNKTKQIVNDILLDGLAGSKPSDSDLENLLQEANKKNKKLRVKLGIDPTNPDLHLGHTVCLQALKRFQNHGHLPILIIGGFTATVGDPSGRNETRPPLTYEKVKENSKTYLAQVGKILDLKNVEVYNNYDWFSKFKLSELLELAHIVTVNQLIAKEAFGKRISEGQPLYLHELLYPLLQGYDSVQVKSDIEIGGIDQTFNIFFGRQVQKHFNQKEQLAIFYPLLIGLDGTKKMSKSFNNYIGLNDLPEEIYGKAMSISDDLIIQYFKLVTDFNIKEVILFEKTLSDYKNSKETEFSAKDLKMKLAKKLVSQIYSVDVAENSEKSFLEQFKENKIPDSVNEFKLIDPLKITELMFQSKLVSSKAEAKRLIEGGGVKLQSQKISDLNLLITNKHKNLVLQIGKRKFIKIV